MAGAVLVLMAADNAKPYLPGITVTDDHPNGCVDCHKNQGEGKDYRLNVSLAQVEGHPKIDAIVKKLPQDCMMCHKEGGKVSRPQPHAAQSALREGRAKAPSSSSTRALA